MTKPTRPTPPTATEAEAIAARIAREEHLSFRSGNTLHESRELAQIGSDIAARLRDCLENDKPAAAAELARRLQMIAHRLRADSQRLFAESGE